MKKGSRRLFRRLFFFGYALAPKLKLWHGSRVKPSQMKDSVQPNRLTVQSLKFFKRAPADVVGISCATSGTFFARMKMAGSTPALIGLGSGPPVTGLYASPNDHTAQLVPLDVPAKLRGRYASLCLSGHNGVSKILRVQESFDVENRAEVVARMALEQADDLRIATRLLVPGGAKSEARVLAAAFPERQAASMLRLLPAAGTPAPRAIVPAELAVINAFCNDPLFARREDTIGLIHFDHDFSMIALFNDGILSQLRIFAFGVADVLRKLIQSLNVDQQTAEGVLIDGAFDIAHLIEEGCRDLRAQLVISRDFMERSENCTLEKIYLSGPVSLTKPFAQSLAMGDGMEEWNVLEAYADSTSGLMEDALASEPWRLVSAIGSSLGVLIT